MNSEYANQNAYDAISVHGGSGFIMEYKCQRLYRDARIFSIYEGTTQMQVVAAIRYIMNGTYLNIMREMIEQPVSEALTPLRQRVEVMLSQYEESIAFVKDANCQETQDFLARRLYNMTANLVMSLLILDDATKAENLFVKSAHVFVRHAEEENAGHCLFIKNFTPTALSYYRTNEKEVTE